MFNPSTGVSTSRAMDPCAMVKTGWTRDSEPSTLD